MQLPANTPNVPVPIPETFPGAGVSALTGTPFSIKLIISRAARGMRALDLRFENIATTKHLGPDRSMNRKQLTIFSLK